MKRVALCAVVGIMSLLVAGPARAQQQTSVMVEAAYPRQALRGQITIVSVAVPRGLTVQAAEIIPATGVRVTRVTGDAGSTEQAIGWWEITLDVAMDAAPGDRALSLVLPTGRTAPTTITIPAHVPAISGLTIAPQPNGSNVTVQLTAVDPANDLGDAPYVWLIADCGSEPFVATARGKSSAGTIVASLPDPRMTLPGSPPAKDACDVRVRITDTSAIESNTLSTRVQFRAPLVPAVFGVVPPPQAAREADWVEYVNPDDRFTVSFPGKPVVTNTVYLAQYGAVLPAHVYTGAEGSATYAITVVDYNPIERLLTERGRTLPALDLAVHDYGIGYWKTDVRGAALFAAAKFLQRDGKVTSMLTNTADGVVGLQVQFVSNVDQSRTFCSIYMHANRLVIAEAVVPRGYPAPLIFQQSLGWLDEKGNRIRYQTMNYNEPDAPKTPSRDK